jgi:DNA-binding MarR family transcriptional regulator
MEVTSSVVLQVMAALRECAKHINHSTEPLDDVDISLLALAGTEKGRLKPSQAAAVLEIAFPSVTRHVRALQEKGMITIAPDADDGRSYAISLSKAGEAALRDYRDGLVTKFSPAVADWSPEELTTLATQLTRLADSLSTARTARTPTSGIWWRNGVTWPSETDGA